MADAAAPSVKQWGKEDKDKLQKLIDDGKIDITRTNDTQYIDRVRHNHFRERDSVNFRRNFRSYARSVEIEEHYAGYRARLAARGILFCPSSSYFNYYLTIVLSSLEIAEEDDDDGDDDDDEDDDGDDDNNDDENNENEPPTTMSKDKSTKKAAKKKAGPKTTGEDDHIIIDGSNKKQRSSSSAPLWSLTQTKGFTLNPYSKGSKNKVDIVVHNSGVPTEHCQPTFKLALGGKSVEIEWKLPESHFTDEQAEVQAIDPNSARYNAYADTMDKLYRSGNQAVDGFFRGDPQVVKLNVECTGVPKTERFNVLTDKTVRYQGRDHIQFDSMYVCTLKVAESRHSRVRATKDAGIAAFGKRERGGGGGSGDGGGGGGAPGWTRGATPNYACRQPPPPPPVQDDPSSSSSDEE